MVMLGRLYFLLAHGHTLANDETPARHPGLEVLVDLQPIWQIIQRTGAPRMSQADTVGARPCVPCLFALPCASIAD